MNELINVVLEDGKELVSAKELHKALEVGRDFSTWVKDRIKEYGFEENVDFTMVSLIPQNGGIKNGRGGDRKSVDYIVSIDMAKELAMIEKTPKGREVRKWFIARENKLKELEKEADRIIDELDEKYRAGKLDNCKSSSLDEIVYMLSKLSKRNGKKIYNLVFRLIEDCSRK